MKSFNTSEQDDIFHPCCSEIHAFRIPTTGWIQVPKCPSAFQGVGGGEGARLDCDHLLTLWAGLRPPVFDCFNRGSPRSGGGRVGGPGGSDSCVSRRCACNAGVARVRARAGAHSGATGLDCDHLYRLRVGVPKVGRWAGWGSGGVGFVRFAAFCVQCRCFQGSESARPRAHSGEQ